MKNCSHHHLKPVLVRLGEVVRLVRLLSNIQIRYSEQHTTATANNSGDSPQNIEVCKVTSPILTNPLKAAPALALRVVR